MPMLSKFVLNLLIGEAVLKTALQKLKPTEAQLADLYGYREMPPPPSARGRLQGGAARRRLGNRPLHAQRLGAQPL